MEVFYVYQQSNQNLSDEKQQQNSLKHFLESKLNDEIEKNSFKESMKIDHSLNHGDIDFEQNINEVNEEIKKAKDQLSNLLNNPKAKTDKIIKSISQNYDNLKNYEKNISNKEKDIQDRYKSILNIVSKREQATKFTSGNNFIGINEPVYHSNESLGNTNLSGPESVFTKKVFRKAQHTSNAGQALSKSKSANALKGWRRTAGLESLPPR